ncbi:MAG: acyl carrier protein [Planctomycetota bacterium]
MADLEDVEKRVKQVTSDVLGVPVDQISNGSRFVQDLHAESIQSIELVAGFEAEFDIEMDEDEALEVKNVGDAVEFIAKYVDEKEDA